MKRNRPSRKSVMAPLLRSPDQTPVSAPASASPLRMVNSATPVVPSIGTFACKPCRWVKASHALLALADSAAARKGALPVEHDILPGLACCGAQEGTGHGLRYAGLWLRPPGTPRRGAIGQARQVGAGGRQGPAPGRCVRAYRHHPVEDAARNGAQPIGLARARLLR